MADPEPPETRDETTPLVGGRRGTQDPEAVASSEDSIQTEQQVKTWRRRRWVSFVASISLLIAFVVILILSGCCSD
ncbi:peptidase family M13 [Apiospora sp. TS-2023a]